MENDNFIGFEVGATNELITTAGTVAMETTIVRTGTYALRVNPTGANTGIAKTAGTANNGGAFSRPTAARWWRFSFYIVTLPTTEEKFVEFNTNTPTVTNYVTVTGAGAVKVYDYDGTLNGTASVTLAASRWYDVEIFQDPTNSLFTLLIDGVQAYNTAALSYGTTAGMDCGFGGSSKLNNEDVDFVYDDYFCRVSTNRIGDVRVLLSVPTSDGATQQWTGDYTKGDEIPPNITDYLVSANANDIAEMNCAAFSLDARILAVQAFMRVREDATGATGLCVRLRSGATVLTTDGFDASTSYTSRTIFASTDPATSAEWTPAAVDAAVPGVIETAGVASRCTAIYKQVAYRPHASPARSLMGVGR